MSTSSGSCTAASSDIQRFAGSVRAAIAFDQWKHLALPTVTLSREYDLLGNGLFFGFEHGRRVEPVTVDPNVMHRKL